MLHFVLCDDNLQMLDRLNKSLETIFVKNDIDAQVSFKSNIPEDILGYVEKNPVDVLILDINLKSSISGCDIANIVRKKNKNVYLIFLTAHLEYALVAYKYKTFDYISKPICDERIEETILRLVDDAKNSATKYIKLKNNVIIKQDSVNFIKKDGMKLVFCTASHNYETYGSFSKIQDCLPDNFVRCHKSYIVNVNNITDLAANNSVVKFTQNLTCLIGEKYKNHFWEVFSYENITNNLECVNK